MKKRKIDTELDEGLKRFLGPLLEQGPGEAIANEPVGKAAAGAPAAGAAITTPLPERPALPAPTVGQAAPTKQLPTQEVKYYSTKDLFTTQYPSNSSEWVNEMKKKPWMIPLQDGRIVQKLEKLFPTFSGSRASAARYNDYQYRITLEGDLKANAVIKVTASGTESDKVTAYLESIEIPNNAKLPEKGSRPESLDRIRRKGAIDVQTNIDDMMAWATGTKPTERMKNLEKMMDQIYDAAGGAIQKAVSRDSEEVKNVVKNVSTKIGSGQIRKNDRTTIQRELFKELKNAAAEREAQGIEEPAEEKPKEKAAEEHPYYNDFIDIATGKSIGFKKRDAEKFVNWMIQNKKPAKTGLSDAEKIKAALAALADYKKANKTESINLHSFLRKLLLEKKTPQEKHGELEHEKGGKIINELNDQIFNQWFAKKGKGISASTRDRIFEGNMYQWFACDNATFVPKKREGETKGENIELILTGQLVMEAEIWIDARCAETGGLGHWNFYVWDRPTPITSASFQIPPVETTVAAARGRTRV